MSASANTTPVRNRNRTTPVFTAPPEGSISVVLGDDFEQHLRGRCIQKRKAVRWRPDRAGFLYAVWNATASGKFVRVGVELTHEEAVKAQPDPRTLWPAPAKKQSRVTA